MEQLRKSLSEKEDLAQEEALIKETQARQALQEQLREQQDQHREETDRLLRYSSNFIIKRYEICLNPEVSYSPEHEHVSISNMSCFTGNFSILPK